MGVNIDRWFASLRLPPYNDRMSSITVQDIQRDPLAFLRLIEAGEAFVVVRDECALAEVRPLATAAAQPRPFGLCAGRFTVPPDFDRPLPEKILTEFEAP
jgi:antitoxin (DNA-binding transcriptional repressor) of toxin-antitoxin stability system